MYVNLLFLEVSHAFCIVHIPLITKGTEGDVNETHSSIWLHRNQSSVYWERNGWILTSPTFIVVVPWRYEPEVYRLLFEEVQSRLTGTPTRHLMWEQGSYTIVCERREVKRCSSRDERSAVHRVRRKREETYTRRTALGENKTVGPWKYKQKTRSSVTRLGKWRSLEQNKVSEVSFIKEELEGLCRKSHFIKK